MTEQQAPSAQPIPDYMQKRKTRVRILTDVGVIEGDHAHPPGVRLSDSLRNSATGERYLLLTDVEVRARDGSPLDASLSSAPFMLVNASHATAIVPLGEEEEA